MKKRLYLVMLAALAMSVPAWSQSITVNSPVAGNEWPVGATRTITWTSAGVSGPLSIKLRLANAANVPPVLEIAASTANDGSYSWTIPVSVPAGDYLVRVRTVSADPIIYGDSANFKICAASGTSGTFGKSGDLVMQNKNALIDKMKSLKPPDLIPSCTAVIGKVNAVSSFSLGLKNLGDIPYNRQTCDWIKFYYWGVNGTTIPQSIYDMVKTYLPFPIPGGGTHSHVVQYTFTQKGKYTYRVYVNPPECQDQHGNEPDCNLINNGLTEKVFWIE